MGSRAKVLLVVLAGASIYSLVVMGKIPADQYTELVEAALAGFGIYHAKGTPAAADPVAAVPQGGSNV